MTETNNDKSLSLLQLLKDGQFHSGEAIARQLGVSRTSVWKYLKKLASWQVAIYAVRGRGYQIPGGLDLLSGEEIQAALSSNNQLFKSVKVVTSLDSTSSELQRDWRVNPGLGRVVIAEHQSQGRGRKGRKWVSPFAANLYFSVGVELPLGLSALGGLSLAVGISLCRSLAPFCHKKIQVKWPNDLLVDGKKLAGILVEASGDSNDTSFINIGVGVNWAMQDEHGEFIDQAWTNLKPLLKSTQSPSRQAVLIAILTELDLTLQKYLKAGFGEFAREWPSLSAFHGRRIVVQQSNKWVEGIELGVESNGALRLQTEQGEAIFHSGEVSLRPVKCQDEGE